MSEFYGGEQKIINSQEALDFKTRPTREIKITVPKNTTSYYKIIEYDDRYRVERIDKMDEGKMKIYSGNKVGDIREILLPAQYPEQIIFERRDDGFYNMTTKVYAIDPDDKTRTKIAYEKCIVELPKWAGGIPICVRQQEDNILYTIEIPDDMDK